MPSGQANLYLGMLPLFAGLLYFFTPTERQRSRWLAGITGGLLLWLLAATRSALALGPISRLVPSALLLLISFGGCGWPR